MKVISFYKFFSIPKKDLKPLQQTLKKEGENKIKGLLLLATEGINGTLTGTSSHLENYKQFLNSLFQGKIFFFKDFPCNNWSFRRLSVKVKKEIVTMDYPFPLTPEYYNHLEPSDWEKQLKKGPQILDVRNAYEVELGKFKGAKHLNIQNFKDFSRKLKTNQFLNKNKETFIYCTGGIRCEKAIKVMEKQGFQKVFQLNGGILNYLKSHPHSLFEEECFVFDHRVALDQNLKPSKQYKLCPHCGQPGKQIITCSHCGVKRTVCQLCLKKASYFKTCSKNCAYHFKRGHRFKKTLYARQQDLKEPSTVFDSSSHSHPDPIFFSIPKN